MIFVVANAALFIATASSINLLTAALSPVALAVAMFYSYCKRFTSLAHLVLGLSLGIAPAGAYIAATGTLTLAPCILSLLVMTWCGGFDIIYALQDADFDRDIALYKHRTARSQHRFARSIRLVLPSDSGFVGRGGDFLCDNRIGAYPRNPVAAKEYRHRVRNA